MSESEFMRRKFTLTEDLDTDLQKLANRHYDGNVSLCLRTAIADHQASLDGEGQRALRRVERTLRSVDEQSDTLVETIETVADLTQQAIDQHESTLPLTTGGEPIRDAEAIYRLLRECDGSLRVNDIVERLDRSPRRVLQGLELLVDHAYIASDPNDRYHLLGDESGGA